MRQYEWLLYVIFGLLLGMGGAWIAGKPQARDAAVVVGAAPGELAKTPTPVSGYLLAQDETPL